MTKVCWRFFFISGFVSLSPLIRTWSQKPFHFLFVLPWTFTCYSWNDDFVVWDTSEFFLIKSFDKHQGEIRKINKPRVSIPTSHKTACGFFYGETFMCLCFPFSQFTYLWIFYLLLWSGCESDWRQLNWQNRLWLGGFRSGDLSS